MKTPTTGNDFNTELLAAILDCSIEDISTIKEWQEKYQVNVFELIYELHYEDILVCFRTILTGIAKERHYLFLSDCEKILRTQNLYDIVQEQLDVCINLVAFSYKYDNREVQCIFEQYQANNYQPVT